MPKSVYLAGPIAGLHHREADSWRQEARTLLNAAGLRAYSPLRYRYEHMDGVIHAGEYDHPLATDRAIHQRDRNDVRACDLMLACFLGAEKGSLGTAVEFGWADVFGKLVILVIEPQGNPHDHAPSCGTSPPCGWKQWQTPAASPRSCCCPNTPTRPEPESRAHTTGRFIHLSRTPETST